MAVAAPGGAPVRMELDKSRLNASLYSFEVKNGTAEDFASKAKMADGINKLSGNWWKSWQERFCVMKPCVLLFYFADKHDTTPRGVVMLDENATVENHRTYITYHTVLGKEGSKHRETIGDSVLS